MTPTKTETVTDLVAQLREDIDSRPVVLAAAPPDITALAVTDEVTYARVGLIVQECAHQMGKIESRWEKVKKAAFALHKSVCGEEATELAPFKQVRKVGTDNMLEYKRLEIEERRRLEREAAAKAEAERQRLAAEERNKQAEQQRLEAAAREARRQGDIRAAKEMTAQAATVKQEIAEVKEEASQVTEEVVRVPAAAAAGVGERRPWTGEVFDANLLIKAVAEGKFPLMHLCPQRGGPDKLVPIIEISQAVIDHYAKRQQDSMAIPGVRAVQGFGLSIKKG